jgi:hypothetical protein
MSDPDFKPPPPRSRRSDHGVAEPVYRGPDRRGDARLIDDAQDTDPATLMHDLSGNALRWVLIFFFHGIIWFGIGWLTRSAFI